MKNEKAELNEQDLESVVGGMTLAEQFDANDKLNWAIRGNNIEDAMHYAQMLVDGGYSDKVHASIDLFTNLKRNGKNKKYLIDGNVNGAVQAIEQMVNYFPEIIL